MSDDIKTEIQAHLAAETRNVKTWFQANKGEAIALLSVAFVLGLMLGGLAGYLLHTHP